MISTLRQRAIDTIFRMVESVPIRVWHARNTARNCWSSRPRPQRLILLRLLSPLSGFYLVGRQPVKEIYLTGLQRIFGADDQQVIELDQSFENL